MSQIDDTITTYLTALAVEGKRPRTIESYDETLRVFRRAGRKLALPEAVEDYTIEHAYAFIGDLQGRGASTAYRNRRHREVSAFFSWCQKMGHLDPAQGRNNPLARAAKHTSYRLKACRGCEVCVPMAEIIARTARIARQVAAHSPRQ